MGFPRGLKRMPLKFIVAQGIKRIQSYGRADFQVFVDRLRDANDAEDHEEVAKILSEFASHVIQIKGKGLKT